DGYWYFASATELARVALSDSTSPVVVAGIGYPDDSAYLHHVLAQRGPMIPSLAGLPLARSVPFLEREYDLTLPASDEELKAQNASGEMPEKSRNVGGLDDFLKIIETEVKPRVAALVPVDRTKQVIFGQSLGGLAALHALFVEPSAFRTFLIASPS